MDQGPASSSDNANGSSSSSTKTYGLYDETCFDRIYNVLCCTRKMKWKSSRGSSSLIRPPGLTDSLQQPRPSDGTLYNVSAISPDSLSAPTCVGHDSHLLPQRQYRATGKISDPHSSTASSSGSVKEHCLSSKFSKQPANPKSDNLESINQNADTLISSDTTTFESLGQVAVNFWSRIKQWKLTVSRSQPTSLASPTEQSPPVSTNPEAPSDILKPDDVESVKIIVSNPGSIRAVYKKTIQTADESACLLPVDEKTGEEVLELPMSTPMKSFLSADKLDVQITSKSTDSLLTSQGFCKAEEMASEYEFFPLVEESTDAEISSNDDELDFTLKLPEQSTGDKKTACVGRYDPRLKESTQISEMSISPYKSGVSEEELNLISKLTESFPTTYESTNAEKMTGVSGYCPLEAESTGAQILEIPMSTPTKSLSSGIYLDSTSPQSSDTEKTGDRGRRLQLLEESTGAQVSDIWMSTPTRSVSSGVELDLTSKSTESLSATQPFSADKTGAGGIYIQFMKASASRRMSEFSISTSNKSFSSGDELDFTSKSIESLSNIQQVTGVRQEAAQEKHDLTKVPDSQVEESADSKEDDPGKCSQEDGKN